MASVTAMTSFSAGALVARRPVVGPSHRLVVAKATVRAQCQDSAKANVDIGDKDYGRRAAVFAVAAVVGAVVGRGIAVAEEEPKRGTPEAKKKYAPICVTMPTARICNKIA